MKRYIFHVLKPGLGTLPTGDNTLLKFDVIARTDLDAFRQYCVREDVQSLSENDVGAITITVLPCDEHSVPR